MANFQAHGVTHTSGSATLRVEKNLSMTREADEFLADLSRRTKLKEGDVLRLALVLLKSAVDAREQVKHVGIADDPEALDIEFSGF